MRVHRIRQIQGYLGDKEMTYKLVDEVAPRYAERNGGYLRILKLGPRQGDNAPMARIELVAESRRRRAHSLPQSRSSVPADAHADGVETTP